MSRKVGFEGEHRAASYLNQEGFQIVERNFYTKFGEIDIVALKDGVLHFVEVKYSKKSNPIERITPQKLSKLLKTITLYLQQRKLDLPYQLDAVIIQDETIEFIENITF